jgi:hypothetical protein
MRPLAAIFAGITLLAVLLGFALDVIPILSQCGRIAAAVGLVGFTITAFAALHETNEEQHPLFERDVDGVQA